jgi:hypothetical protein
MNYFMKAKFILSSLLIVFAIFLFGCKKNDQVNSFDFEKAKNEFFKGTENLPKHKSKASC